MREQETLDRGWQLRPVTDADREPVHHWRNLPEVRRAMLTEHRISAEEHARWWQRMRAAPDKCWLILEQDTRPMAVICFFDIDREQGSAWWGFYLTDEVAAAERLSTWVEVERQAVEYAFTQLELGELLCETRVENAPVLALHRRFGFVELERAERQGRDGGREVVVMRLPNPAGRRATPLCRVGILGSANWDLAAEPFRRQLREVLGGAVEIYLPPFGQYRQMIADPRSALAAQRCDYWLFAERFEDLIAADSPADSPHAFELYLAAIVEARERLEGRFLLLELAPVMPRQQLLAASATSEADSVVLTLNRRLARLAEQLPDTHLLGLESVVREVGTRQADPGKYWYLARAPFSLPLLEALGMRLAAAILALEARRTKVLVVDLDNTLWGGVLGEVGQEGIAIGGDYPGNLYAAVQELLRQLSAQGIALAICSKNDEATALAALREHPQMRLRPEAFAAHRINWRSKAENLEAIARELNVGLEALCFIDDNPLERAEVRAMLPSVTVPEMPEVLTEWPRFLTMLPNLAALQLTDSDRRRAESYRQRAQLQREASRFESREAFLASLQMSVRACPPQGGNLARILQLLQRTNQFNATTRRHGEQALAQLQAAGAEVWGIAVADRFTAEEIVGVIILHPEPACLHIETLLLSCRVLGRGVETAMLAWAAARAQARGESCLTGEVIESGRNGPVLSLYVEHGFVEHGAGRFRLDLTRVPLQMPAWIAWEATPEYDVADGGRR